MSWLFYIDDFNKPRQDLYGSKTYWFKTWKVYWAYRWWNAKQTDEHNAKTPIKTTTGFKRDITNYQEKYT